MSQANEDTINVKSEFSNVKVREFNKEMVAEFKEDSEYQYIQPPEKRPNLLMIMFRMLLTWLTVLLGNEAVAWLVIVILIIIGVIGLGFGFYGLFGVGKTIPVFSKEKDGLDYDVKDENIHEINFADEIETAVNQQDFKKAVRLVYLYSLKILTDQKIIEWIPSKTNHDYSYEIQSSERRGEFQKISYIFDNIWYGDYTAEARHYKEINNTFKELKSSLEIND